MLADARQQLADEDIAERYARSLRLLDEGQHEPAATLLERIEQERPGYRDATALLAAARQAYRRTTDYQRARAAEDNGDWTAAIRTREDEERTRQEDEERRRERTRRKARNADGKTRNAGGKPPGGKPPCGRRSDS